MVLSCLYEEVCAFVLALTAALEKRGLNYGIAAEHAHSCCILIASDRFKKEGKWHTRIDYAKFFERLESGEPFTPEDYMGPETPVWATWRNGGVRLPVRELNSSLGSWLRIIFLHFWGIFMTAKKNFYCS